MVLENVRIQTMENGLKTIKIYIATVIYFIVVCIVRGWQSLTKWK